MTTIEKFLTKHYTPEVLHIAATKEAALEFIARAVGYETAAEAAGVERYAVTPAAGWVWGTAPEAATVVTIGYGALAADDFYYVLHAVGAHVHVVRGVLTGGTGAPTFLPPGWKKLTKVTAPAYVGDAAAW